jgi:uncharacterized membrane protein YraQ (UPF0718 family)
MELNESFSIFTSIVVAIFLEAMPFLALGAMISAIIEVYFPLERFTHLIPQRFAGGVALGVSAGFLIPTCECGVVPIVRRLIMKGVPPYIAISYMLAAPIVNPVVLASTYIAFRGNLSMLFGRVLIAVVAAVAVAVFVKRSEEPLLLNDHKSVNHNHHDHHHDHHHHGDHQSGLKVTQKAKILAMLRHAGHDFLDMGKFLILGAFAAAFFKTFLPQDILRGVENNLLFSIFGMMLLAVLLSICSEADAFVAASFLTFPAAAQLAFVTIGPMVDLKLLGMYAGTFRSRIVLALVVIPTVVVLLLSLVYAGLHL